MEQNSDHIVIFATRFEARNFKSPPGVKVIFSGVGKKRAEKCIKKVLGKYRPHCVINSGFAGGLNPGFQTGTIVYRVSDESDDFLRQSGAIAAKFYCSEKVITSIEEKRELYIKTGADVVDMESEVIFNACREKGIPCKIIRIISDDATTAMPVDFNKPLDIALGVIKVIFVPGYMHKLNEFSKKMYEAAKTLGEFLRTYFEHHTAIQK